MTNLVLPPLSNPFLPHLFCSSSSGSEDGVDEGAVSCAVWGGVEEPSPAFCRLPRVRQCPRFATLTAPVPLRLSFSGEGPVHPHPLISPRWQRLLLETGHRSDNQHLYQRVPSPGDRMKGHRGTALVRSQTESGSRRKNSRKVK